MCKFTTATLANPLRGRALRVDPDNKQHALQASLCGDGSAIETYTYKRTETG